MPSESGATGSGKNLEHLIPWLPESFWQENFLTIAEIFEKLTNHYPNMAVPRLSKADNLHPATETRQWMWQKLMGGQHGYHRGADGKVYISSKEEPIFTDSVRSLHYGPYGFMDSYTPGTGSYDKAFVLGGSPDENTIRMMAAVNGEPLDADIDQVIMMAGQRPRWNIASESSIADIYKAVSDNSPVNMETLRSLSPFIKEQERRDGAGWDRPYPSEFELARLTVEAVFMDAIDWKDYPVEKTHDLDANPQTYKDVLTGKTKTFPGRELAMVTYLLNDGRKVHITNSLASPRPQGEPKPTSDTTVRDAIGRIGIGNSNAKEAIVISTSAPHFRAALDALIRILQLRGDSIKKVDINSGPYSQVYERLISGLGEIPATYKADRRLHAVLTGHDPDTEELKSL